MPEKIYDKIIISLIYLVVFSLLISLAVISARYKQRFSNIELLKKKSVNARTLIYYHDEYFLESALTIRHKVEEFIEGSNQQLDERDLYKLSAFAYKIGNEYLEAISSQILLSNKAAKYDYSCVDYKTKYLLEILHPSIRAKMEQNDYENACYRAQRFINYYNNNPELLANHNRKSMYARKTISNITGNYLYDSKDIITLVDNINWYDDFQRGDNKKNEIESVLEKALKLDNLKHQDFIGYALYDIRENTLKPIEKVDLWEEYINNYPKSKFTAEAHFNELINLFSIQLQTLFESEEKYGEISRRFYDLADKFLRQHRKSYLIDDAIYYSIVFSGLDNNEKIIDYLKALFSDSIDGRISHSILTNVFKTNNFDYTKFILDAIKIPINKAFDEYIEYARLDSEYFRQLKCELYRFEGKNYGKLTLEKIIINIAARNL